MAQATIREPKPNRKKKEKELKPEERFQTFEPLQPSNWMMATLVVFAITFIVICIILVCLYALGLTQLTFKAFLVIFAPIGGLIAAIVRWIFKR